MDHNHWNADDQKFMQRALKLAGRGRGTTSPNPMVGAVIVKNGRIVGEAYHKRAGELHAEALALQKAGSKSQGATLYVNLEPCCHQGQTPPCVPEIIAARVSRVVVAMQDPNPLVNGLGLRQLREAGVQVEVGLLEERARHLNEVFVKYITTRLPFVILKVAITLDGKIATKTGDSQWISNEASRAYVHKLRNEVDATLVGIGTIVRDNSRLTTRLIRGPKRDPIRIVVDSLLKVPLRANIFTQDSNANNIIVTTPKAFFQRHKEIEATGSKVLEVRTISRNKVDLKDMLEKLGKMGITSLMIEGGAQISASALREGIVDKLIFFIAPKIVGGNTAPGPVGGEGVARISEAIKIVRTNIRRFGDDIMVEGYLEKPPNCAWGHTGCDK